MPPGPIVYPSSDGKRMAESTKQARWITVLYGNLLALYRERADVFVAADNLWYPVEKHPEIVPVYSELSAYLVLVALLKKNCLQQAAVPLIEAIQNMPDKLASVIRDDRTQGVGSGLDEALRSLIFQCLNAVGTTVLLHQNVVADRVHQGAKAFGMAKTAFAPYQRKRPGKRLLFHVLNQLRPAQPGP